MNLFEVMARFPSQESCIVYLEQIRWGENPCCPHCGSVNVYRKSDGERVGRWHCKDCHASYNVLAKTLFQGTQVPLQKWFVAIALTMNAKKSLSSHQLARDLNLNQKTAWYMMQRIRVGMIEDENFLKGIIEADETFLGGRPKKRKDDDGNLPPPSKRGRGTQKAKILGAVERGGKVVAKMVSDLGGTQIFKFVTRWVNTKESEIITDEWRGYNPVGQIMKRSVIKHSSRIYVDPDNPSIHTNTIEGFWALLKRAFNGTHHHYSKKHTQLYLAEACYKYNHRDSKDDLFDVFIKQCVR